MSTQVSIKTLETIELETATTCQYSVIWLHGLGASGHDFEPIVPELGLGDTVGVRFIFPHAPVRPITINGGAPMPGWYDIDSLDFGQRKQDITGIEGSADQVNALIEAEIKRGIAASNIILAGFSQGGAIALFTALTRKHKLAGVMALSTYLPVQDRVVEHLSAHAAQLPVFMAHGQFDDVIQMQHAQQSHEKLTEMGLAVQWHDYPMAHSVSAEEIADISLWLKDQLGL